MALSDLFNSLNDPNSKPLYNQFVRQYEKSTISLEQVEDELGMLEAMLIDAPQYASGPSVGSMEWWTDKTDMITSINPLLSGVDVKETLLGILRKSGSDESVQEELFDILGMDLFEFITELLERRQDLISASIQSKAKSKELKKPTKKEEKRQNEMKLEEALKLVYTTGQAEAVQYPFVFSSNLYSSSSKSCLPEGTVHVNYTEYEQFTIPHHKKALERAQEYPLINVDSTNDPILKTAFQSYKTLNRMQSICFDTAYNTNENMLVCAPTGAGKTDVAMLTVCKCIKEYTKQSRIDKSAFKIIYVAPMKALAAEITAKFQKRLAGLGVKVRECTGDMQLTRQEIQDTQMLVTTPEKWDVLSRKGVGDVELVQLVRLLIIDEVHLLHDDRGAVLEAIVARCLRQVEIGQSMIRILGLSATLPNYVDVAAFLRVNPFAGMFFFDDAFRPVPLTQHFVGVKGGTSTLGYSGKQQEMIMSTCYERCVEYLTNQHQVMIFVHSRNDTVKTARSILRMASDRNDHGMFMVDQDHKLFPTMSKQVGRSRNNEVKELFNHGIGIHHAGMIRSDRSLTEELFEKGLLRVLVCTATLAWGVNLPAHAVIIKGTQVYDSDKGGFVDLSVLDVLQIFGRAGRPQFETHGECTIITTHNRLQHYLQAVSSRTPIESKFVHHLADNLNAEVALGTVSSVQEAVQWLTFTFLYVRMRRNPLCYGITLSDRVDDPTCSKKLLSIIRSTAEHLKRCGMIAFDDGEGFLKTKNIGRIASLFYLSHCTIELFVKQLRPDTSQEDLLDLVCQSSEFESVKVREEELEELERIHSSNCFIRIKGDLTSVATKVNILTQCYISRYQPDLFSLQADLNYIQQNTGRILRALFEIVKGLSWASCSRRVLQLCCQFERRRWLVEHALTQFENVPVDVVGKLVDLDALYHCDLKEIGILARNHKAAGLLRHDLDRFPRLTLEYRLQPLTHSILQLSVQIKPDFYYDQKCHGAQETFHVWIEDPTHLSMLAYQLVSWTGKELIFGAAKDLLFHVQSHQGRLPASLYLCAVSDRWLHSESIIQIVTSRVKMPVDEVHTKTTELLALSPLPITALQDQQLIKYYTDKNLHYFNAVQTQSFHTLYHQNCNVLIGAPTGSGKTVMAELAIFRAIRNNKKVIYLAPLRALVKERIKDWKESLRWLNVVEMSGDYSPSFNQLHHADLIVATPEKFDAVSRKWTNKSESDSFQESIGLLIMDEVHLLGVADRGPVLEAIVMRIQQACPRVRLLALSTALANAQDLADWLKVPPIGLFNFSPAVRPVPVQVRIEGFPGAHYCPRMASMNKPLYQHIKTLSDSKPTLVFVSSRRQTRLTAEAIISLDNLEHGGLGSSFLPIASRELVESAMISIQDVRLKHCLSFGVGLHHAGLSAADKSIVESLFLHRHILLLIATSTLAWGINLPSFLVIIKGTEYFDAKRQHNYIDMPVTDVMQMVGRAGRPQFDETAKAVLLVAEAKKTFYRRFLYESFPVESGMVECVSDHLNAQVQSGRIQCIRMAVEWLQSSFLWRRLGNNPAYYNLKTDPIDWAVELIRKSFTQLSESGCIQYSNDDNIVPLFPGKLASHYYLSHLTIKDFLEGLDSVDSIDAVISMIAFAREYCDAPLRHNEDHEVCDFCSAHPLVFTTLHSADFTDPRTKVYVLIKSWIHRLTLPYCDFEVDQKLALEQAFRIGQALLELSVVHGEAERVRNVLHGLQCMRMQCEYGVDPLQVYLSSEECEYLRNNCRVKHLPELLERRHLFTDFSKTLPDIDLRSGKYHNIHTGPTGEQCNWYVLETDHQDMIVSFKRLTKNYKLPRVYNHITLISDSWYGLDQDY